MLHKTYSLLDAKADGETGTFEATVAVFGNVDKGGDRIVRGAFKDTLHQWDASGDPIPVILSHQWDNVFAHIGVIDEAKETAKGLWVKGTLDVGDNEVARQVHKLMARRSLKEFSFGYEVAPGGEKRAKDGANELLKINLAEVGPTLKGMNPATELHAVKSALGVLDPEELRKESGRLEREVADEQIPDVPPVDPGPEPPKVEDLTEELAEVKAKLADAETALAPPPDTKELRKESERLERELVEEQLPDVPTVVEDGPPPPKIEDLVAELAEVKARITETPPPDTELLRKESQRLAREIVDATIPDVPAAEPEPKEPDVDVLQELADVKARLAAAEQALTPPPDTEELRKESQRLEREIAEEQIPELPPAPPPEPDVDLLKELHEVKARLETTEQALTDLKKKAEETDKEQHARSVDPLRKRSEERALEIASDGMSLRKPPTQAPPAPPEPFDSEAVRRQSRDLMFEVLSYSTGSET